MMLEKQLEDKVLGQLSSISQLSGCQFICSRSIAPIGRTISQDDSDHMITITSSYRQHEAFSLPMIDVDIAIVIASRVEMDATACEHENIVEKISDKISYWHFNGNDMASALSSDKMMCGELKSTGGSGRTYDDTFKIWTDTIGFQIRGSEIFNN